MPEYSLDDAEVFGEIGEDGRPANIPEKYYRPGEGDDKPASVDLGGLLTEYHYRSKQLGAADGLIGVPENGYQKPEIEVPEGVEYELADDDPMLSGFAEFAKERNLSQKAYNDIVGWYAQQQISSQQAAAAAIEAEFAKIGPDGKEQVQRLTQQVENLTKGLPDDQKAEIMKGLQTAVVSAETFKFVNMLIGKAQPAALPDGDGVGAGALTRSKVREMQEAVITEGPQKGKRRYEVDPAYREEVRAAWSQVVGGGPAASEQVSFSRT